MEATTGERKFYHSFPRWRSSEPADVTIAKGMAILKALKEVGLVLAPEVVEWRIPQIDGSTKTLRHRQTRICFTELSRTELEDHANTFGPFALEIPIEILRQYGVLPVIYVPQMVSGDRLLSSFGPVIVWMFENIRYTLDNLDQLSKLSDPQIALEIALKTHPEATHVAPDYSLNLTNVNKHNEIVKEYSVKASVVRDILNYLNFETAPFALMRGAIWAAQNLFYPTDDHVNDKVLSYYRQREWRIVPGATVEGKTVARYLTPEEKVRITEIDHSFWTRELVDDKGTFRRIDEAQIIDEFRGRHISQVFSKVLVPHQDIGAAEELLLGFAVEPVTPER